MTRRSSVRHRLVSAMLFVLALAGWAAAATAILRVGDLTGELAAAATDLSQTKADLSTGSEDLTAARAELRRLQEAVRDRAELTKQVASHRAELASLRSRIEESATELDGLRGEAKGLQALLSGAAPNYVATTWARLRAGPSTASKELAVVGAGSPLRLIEVLEDGKWYKVGNVGFMYHTLLEPAR